jgi:predicted nuclease with TOPRIM domain
MLSELDQLSQNISRLIAISSRRILAQREMEARLAQAEGDLETARQELAALRVERDTLREERDGLAAKIDDAQVRLNAILEKLPHSKTHANQLDLLEAMPAESETDLADTAEHDDGDRA